jgi:hypothetical protein
MSSSSEDGEENDHSEQLAVNAENYCRDDQISKEMRLHGEPSSELETDSENG